MVQNANIARGGGRRADESGFDDSEDVQNVRNDVDAEVGDLKFKDEFSDPDVEVTHDRDTVDHELVTGHTAYKEDGVEFVIQAMGRNAPQIDITGWVTKEQLEIVDDLVSESRVRINSNRWSGAAVPLRTDINYNRTYHNEHGQVFEVDIELLGTDRNGYPKEEVGGADPTGRERLTDFYGFERSDRIMLSDFLGIDTGLNTIFE